VTPFPPDRKGYRDYRDYEKSRDKAAAEPVVALAPIEHDLEAGKSDRYQHDTNVVDPELPAAPCLAAFLGEFGRIVNESAGKQ